MEKVIVDFSFELFLTKRKSTVAGQRKMILGWGKHVYRL